MIHNYIHTYIVIKYTIQYIIIINNYIHTYIVIIYII